jgi:hypothetical protein
MALLLGTTSLSAMGQDYDFVPPPDAAVPAGTVPRLFPSEQGASAIIEAFQQAAESYIAQNGCGSKTWGVSVATDFKGNGTGSLSSGFTVQSAFVPAVLPATPKLGRAYQVTGGGVLNGISVSNYVGNFVFTIGSQILSGSANWGVSSLVAPGTIDPFSGLVVKDFWRPTALFTIPSGDYQGIAVTSVIDWGYQAISKKGYPIAKYWQASRMWRDNGVSAETHFLKTRVAAAPYTAAGCTISVDLDTNNAQGVHNVANIERFEQYGWMRIGGVDPGLYRSKQK